MEIIRFGNETMTRKVVIVVPSACIILYMYDTCMYMDKYWIYVTTRRDIVNMSITHIYMYNSMQNYGALNPN